jgi:hypothetical protein
MIQSAIDSQKGDIPEQIMDKLSQILTAEMLLRIYWANHV